MPFALNIAAFLVDTLLELIKQTRTPRKLKQEPISGWKQTRFGGRRY